MGYIYKITNKINNKIYIGQTTTSIEERMRKHVDKAKNQLEGLTGIDAAIKKYGWNNFSVEQICECPNEDLNIQEQFYISKYNTFLGDGYNLTNGGNQGSVLKFTSQEVIDKYNELKNVKMVAQYFNCCEKTISNILHNNNITIERPIHNIENLLKGKRFQFKNGENVKAVHLIELDIIFNSMKDCAQWLIDNKYSKANSMELARKSLSRALHGDRATYCGFHFEFINADAA